MHRKLFKPFSVALYDKAKNCFTKCYFKTLKSLETTLRDFLSNG